MMLVVLGNSGLYPLVLVDTVMILKSIFKRATSLRIPAIVLLTLLTASWAWSQPTENYLRFDGFNDYVNAGNSASVDITSAFSVEAWVFVESIPNQSAKRIVSKWGFSSGYELAIFNTGTPTVWFTLNQGQTATGDFSALLDQWVHVAATWDGTWTRLYFNGGLVNTVFFGSALASSPNNLTIGEIASLAGSSALQGGIDDVRLWGAALSGPTINDNKDAEVTGSHPNFASLLAYWKFNESSGQTAASEANSPGTDGVLGSSASADASDPAWSGETDAAVAVRTETINSDGIQDFGLGTGVDIDFDGVGGSAAVTVERFASAPSNVTGVSEGNIADVRWVIVGDGLSFSSATQVRFKLSEISGLLLDPGSIVVYKRSTSTIGTLSAVTTVYDSGAGEIVASGFTSFSEFIMASSTLLPVELVDFVGLAGEDRFILEWATLSETNNLGFEVQREIDGRFITLATVAGALNSRERKDYRYEVADLHSGSRTFRLKQINTDGSFSYSRAIEIDLLPGDYALYEAYPNPFNRSTRISYTLPRETDVSVTVFDLLGRQIRVLESGTRSAGTHEVTFDATGLPSGMYTYRLEAGRFVEVRLVVLR